MKNHIITCLLTMVVLFSHAREGALGQDTSKDDVQNAECEGCIFSPVGAVGVTSSTLIELILGDDIDSYKPIRFQGVMLGGSANNPTSASAGIFRGGEKAGIGIERGVVLSTGFIHNAAGPNVSDRITGILNLEGDDDLNTLSGMTTFDATILEFEFQTSLEEIFITFVFGSDEYTQYVNGTKNDVFAFFLNGANIALVPQTTEPISVNTINPGVNSEYYIDNELYEGEPGWPVYCNEMDGFTSALTVSAPVEPGEVNTIKLAIADAEDRLIDSWVFIKEGGLSGQNPGIEIGKTANVPLFQRIDEVVTYTLEVRNTGNVTLEDILVTDPALGLTFTVERLGPGASTLINYPYIITQADTTRGFVSNTATVTTTFGGVVIEDSETLVIPYDPDALNPSLAMTKTADPPMYTRVDEEISYMIRVINDSNTSVSGISVEDDLTGDTWVHALLASGDLVTFTATYVITQADMDRGWVQNNAFAGGVGPLETPATTSASSTIGLQPASRDPRLAVSKTASQPTYAAVGESIGFTLTVTNTGNLTVGDITVEDELTGDSWPVALLTPGELVTMTATYDITQADMDRGWVRNEVLVSGEDPQGGAVNTSGSYTLSRGVGAGQARLAVSKTASQTTYASVGDAIGFTLTLTNTGNLTVSEITVEDELTGDSWPVALLAPGELVTMTATYAITQADMDHGTVRNVVLATGEDPQGTTVTASDTINLVRAEGSGQASLALSKTASQPTYAAVGDAIGFTLTVTNTGNLTISDITVEDELTGDSWPFASLAPGGLVTRTATYAITQADMDRGWVQNIALATGTDPHGVSLTATDTFTVILAEGAGQASLALSKTASQPTFAAVGEQIGFPFTVTNSGKLTISDILVEDELTGDSWLLSSLAPGELATMTATYAITQADMDRGWVQNVALATGTDPQGGAIAATATATITLDDDARDPELTLAKTASQFTYSATGETIDYTITVTNTGNLTISDIQVEDALTGDTWQIPSLAPGGTTQFTTSHVITQNDMDHGSVLNTALATGKSPWGEPVTGSGSLIVTLGEAARDPRLTVSKTSGQPTFTAIGDTIGFTVTVTNSGNLTISDIHVEDALTGDDWLLALLAPGELATLTTTYTITQADMDRGRVRNVAVATGEDAREELVTASDTLTVTLDEEARNPQLSVNKTAGQPTFSAVDETIGFTIVVTNSGNLTLHDITVEDDLTGDAWLLPLLAPGELATYTATYTITQEDMDRGWVRNMALATGNDPQAEMASSTDTFTVTIEEEARNPQLTVLKTPQPNYFSEAGQEIIYTISVSNTGNISITDIHVEDELTGDTWTVERLLPGASRAFPTSYVTTPANVTEKQVVNTAFAVGKDPAGREIRDETRATIYVCFMDVSKEIVAQACLSPGDTLVYIIALENNGLCSLTNVEVYDFIPLHTSFVAASHGGLYNSSTGEVVWQVPVIPASEVVNLELTLAIDSLIAHRDTIVNVVRASSDQVAAQASETATVIAHPPRFHLVSASGLLCHGDTDGVIETEVLYGTPPFTFAWSNGANTQNLQNVGAGDYTLVITDANGCTTTGHVTVTGPEALYLFNVQITGVDYIDDPEGAITLEVGGGVPPYDYLWDTGDVTRDLEGITGGDYLLTITDANGCQLQEYFYVPHLTDECEFLIPGAITPNDDGYNDYFYIRCLYRYPAHTLTIFNRYGTVIYEASPYDNSWDGAPNRGQVLTDPDGRVPSGTYFYLLQIENGPGPFSGYIYLVK